MSGAVFVSIRLKAHDGSPPRWRPDSIGNYQNSSVPPLYARPGPIFKNPGFLALRLFPALRLQPGARLSVPLATGRLSPAPVAAARALKGVGAERRCAT